MPVPVKTADLCWGQRYIWLRHHQLPPEARHEAHIVCNFDMPPGVRVAGIRSMLNYLVRRHEVDAGSVARVQARVSSRRLAHTDRRWVQAGEREQLRAGRLQRRRAV